MRRPTRAPAAVFTLAAWWLSGATPGAQLFVSTGRDTLRQLPGVEVLVEPLQPELEASGVSGAAISKQVTARLEANGITIYRTQRENPAPSKPYVYVHINAASTGRGRDLAVAVQLHLRQTVQSTTTESRIVNAMTWDAHDLIVSEMPAVNRSISTKVDELLSAFIEDWRAVH
jgi:hypothetical protein